MQCSLSTLIGCDSNEINFHLPRFDAQHPLTVKYPARDAHGMARIVCLKSIEEGASQGEREFGWLEGRRGVGEKADMDLHVSTGTAITTPVAVGLAAVTSLEADRFRLTTISRMTGQGGMESTQRIEGKQKVAIRRDQTIKNQKVPIAASLIQIISLVKVGLDQIPTPTGHPLRRPLKTPGTHR